MGRILSLNPPAVNPVTIVNPENIIKKQTDRQMNFMSGVDWNDTQTTESEFDEFNKLY